MLSQVNFINAALESDVKGDGEFILEGFGPIFTRTFYLLGDRALIKTHTEQPRYDWVQAKGEKTARQVAREYYADLLIALREGI